MRELSVRGGAGLGDALYVQSVARYLLKSGPVEVCTHWPSVFQTLNCRVSGFRRQSIDVLAHYYSRRDCPKTTQWEDICTTAQIPLDTPIHLNWEKTSPAGDEVRELALVKPVAIVGMPRAPFDRKDGFGRELLPCSSGFRRVFSELKKDYFVVLVGLGSPTYSLGEPDLDLVNRTTVDQLFDIALEADLLVGQPSYMIPLAESLNKRALIVWSSRAKEWSEPIVQQKHPDKIVHRKDLISSIYDDADMELVRDKVFASFGSGRDLQGKVGSDRGIGTISLDERQGAD